MRTWLFGLLLCPFAAQAATHCSTSAEDLRADLAAAQASAEADEVRVAAGTYQIHESIMFAQAGPDEPTGSLALSGGWNAACTQQSRGAQHTGLVSTGAAVVFAIDADGDVRLSDLHFVDMVSVGARSTLDDEDFTTVELSRVAVLGDDGVGDAISAFTPADRVVFDNVLVDVFALCSVATASFSTGGQVEFFSSTIISREEFGAAVCFDGSPDAALNGATNSVFAAQPSGFSILSNGLPALLGFSAYENAAGCPNCEPPVPPLHPESESNLEQTLPFEETAGGELARFTRIAAATALIGNLRDSGTDEQPFLFDVMGNPRSAGAAIDRGAFELPEEATVVFADGFE